MNWTSKEVEELKLYIEDGLTHEQIAELINEEFETARTAVAVSMKCSRLGFKSKNSVKHTTEQYKKQIPEGIAVLEEYVNDITKILHRHSCGHEWKANPNSIKAGKSCPVCTSNAKHTTKQYKLDIPEGIELLEEYVNAHTPILHKHSCGYKWLASPHNIKQGSGCPVCAKHGFDPTKIGFTYFIYFEELDLYKIGISNNMTDRFKQFGYKPGLIFYREFKIGSAAALLEKQWLKNVSHLMLNMGDLETGNTETFYIK